MPALAGADLDELILSFVLSLSAIRILSRVSKEWAWKVFAPQAWANSCLRLETCAVDEQAWIAHARIWSRVASLSVDYIQSSYARIAGVPRYISWRWGLWHLQHNGLYSWICIPCVNYINRHELFNPWVSLSANPMAPVFSLMLSAIDLANPPISIGWTNADNPEQLARLFYDENAIDLNVFILYVNLLPPKNPFTQRRIVGRWRIGSGLHYLRAQGVSYSTACRERCSIGLQPPAILTLCCEPLRNVVEIFFNGVRRVTLPCPFILKQRPGWPDGEIASNRVFALTMCQKRPEVVLIPVASQA